MADFARSAIPGVQAQLDRLAEALARPATCSGWSGSRRCSTGSAIRRIALPPVFHVAGTNGKGSTCAFLRAALEAAGSRSTSSPARTWSASTSGSASPAG